MIELSGLTVRSKEDPAGDIEIVEVGLRPGEKLYEELLIGDNPGPSEHPRILKADEAYTPFEELSQKLRGLSDALAGGSAAGLIVALHDFVPEFQNGMQVVDWVHVEANGVGAGAVRQFQRAARSA